MSASTSAERMGSSSAISPNAMPAVSVASRTPSGRVTCTAPTAQEEQRGRGVAGGDDLLAGLIGPDRAERGEVGQFLFRQARQQRLLGQFGGLVEIDRAAIAIDDLVLGPFDRGIEQIEVADIGRARRSIR